MRVGIITIQDDDGSAFAVVPEEVMQWIKRTDTPGRTGNETGWNDTAAPQCVLDILQEHYDVSIPSVTIGSFENDRALYALGADLFAAHASRYTEGDLVGRLKWINDEGHEVVDTYEGMQY